ncbi:RNase H domain-containing protein [Trichonephila clavata]|uniref:RNase H domain-containing protein n=1 Tax=Trichonephila clavata TaxID=2740835 RepID=A0A8X6JEN2_TRICU|nr:RNase H domain-containing protein [Trichonephila clavata]
MSALESLHSLTERRHPTVMEILLLLRKLERKGFDIIFCWVPGHVGILGNEQADNAARSLSDHMQHPVCYHELKAPILRYIHSVWQETWDQQVISKLHYIHPSITHWTAVPIRRPDVCLTRLRIGHTRLTHRHLLLGESPPVCDFCHYLFGGVTVESCTSPVWDRSSINNAKLGTRCFANRKCDSVGIIFVIRKCTILDRELQGKVIK